MTNADKRRRTILDRAADLFSTAGYANVSVEDIAVAAGMRKPTLYHYFKSREEIVAAMHNIVAGELIAHADGLVEAETPPADALRSIILNMTRGINDRPGYLRVFFEHYREISQPAFRDIAEVRGRYLSIVEDFLAKGMSDGTFRRSEPKVTALAIFGMCNWTYQWYRPGAGMDPHEIAEAFADIVTWGIAAR